MPQINVANNGNDTISAELVVGGNGYQNAEWGITGTGTLNLTNSADSWALRFHHDRRQHLQFVAPDAEPEYRHGHQRRFDQHQRRLLRYPYAQHRHSKRTDNCALNIITGTVNGSQLTIGSSGGGTDTITVARERL